MRIPLVYSEEVAEAVTAGQPVVALASDVLRSGPDSAETARLVEDAVRASGSVPATIGVDKGRILVGLSESDLERFAAAPGVSAVDGRGLPVVLARGTTGAATLSASMVAAGLAGLKFLSSAEIGGVHRGGRRLSPDLVQLTRSKVAVVCAGARNTLDLGLTLEFLETHCVPVVSYRSDDFPAFYFETSGLPSPHRVDDPRVMARAIESHWALGNPGSFLVTTPTKPADAIDDDEIESVKATMAVRISTAEVAGELAAAHAKECPS